MWRRLFVPSIHNHRKPILCTLQLSPSSSSCSTSSTFRSISAVASVTTDSVAAASAAASAASAAAASAASASAAASVSAVKQIASVSAFKQKQQNPLSTASSSTTNENSIFNRSATFSAAKHNLSKRSSNNIILSSLSSSSSSLSSFHSSSSSSSFHSSSSSSSSSFHSSSSSSSFHSKPSSMLLFPSSRSSISQPASFIQSKSKSAIFNPGSIGGASRRLHGEPIPPEIFNQSDTILTTLSNGLRVASQRTADETVTVGVFIDAGSRYETKENNGTAHFLEHMVFKGTQRRSRVQLEKEVEDIGGHLNAYTAREQTAYYAKVFKKDLPQAVDILSDILQNSKFEASAIEEERHVILREMEEVEKSSEEVIFDRLHMAAFRDSPLGFTILGPPENVMRIKRDDIIEYIDENYKSNRMVIVAAGDVDHKQLVDLVQQKFACYTPEPPVRIAIKKEVPYFLASGLVQRYDLMAPFAHVAVGFESVPWNDPAQPVFMVMQSIIGVYDRMNEGLVPATISGNRTINNVSNKEYIGCAENFAAFNTCYKDTGLFGFYIKANEKAIFHAIEELFFSVCCLSYSVTEEEVQTAKRTLKLNLFGLMETTTAICEDIGRQILVYGRRIPAAEMYKRIEMIDSDEVRRVAWDRLYDADIALAGIGSTRGVLPFNYIRRFTKLNRW